MISNKSVTLNSSMGLTPFPGQDLTAYRIDNTFGEYIIIEYIKQSIIGKI